MALDVWFQPLTVQAVAALRFVPCRPLDSSRFSPSLGDSWETRTTHMTCVAVPRRPLHHSPCRVPRTVRELQDRRSDSGRCPQSGQSRRLHRRKNDPSSESREAAFQIMRDPQCGHLTFRHTKANPAPARIRPPRNKVIDRSLPITARFTIETQTAASPRS